MKVKLVLVFKSPLRATKPDHDLITRHLKSIEGRIRPLIQQHYEDLSDEEIEEKINEWRRGLLSVFPRKAFNGVEQVCIPRTYVFGFMHAKASALGVKKLSLNAIKQLVEVSPHLIGLRRNHEPITATEYTTDTVVSQDKFGKRSALRVFEVINPPAYTEPIYITFHTNGFTPDFVGKFFAFGRLGANRKQGYGEFRGRVLEVVEDGEG